MTPTESEFTARTRLALGDGGVERLRRSRVLVLGLGGVGGYAAEILARSGVGHLTVVDGDVIESSNRNRQLIALTGTVGEFKAEAWRRRLLDINPELEVDAVAEFIGPEDAGRLLERPCDYVVEAIDTLASKVHFILECLRLGRPLISSMGSGGRLDPLQVRRCDISETWNCALARAVRSRLRRHGVASGVEVIFSPEPLLPGSIVPAEEPGMKASVIGSVAPVPAAFGVACAATAIKALLFPPK